MTPWYEAKCATILHLVHNLHAHLQPNSALVSPVEEILWNPTTGNFSQSYARWAPEQRRKSMRPCIFVIINFYVNCHQLSALPSAMENLTRQMQDEIEAKAESICQRHNGNGEVCKQNHCHCSAANALYEGALGALPAGYGNNGHMPIDAYVAWHVWSFRASHVLKMT